MAAGVAAMVGQLLQQLNVVDMWCSLVVVELMSGFVPLLLGFEFCVFVAGWRHALRSEWPFIIIIITVTHQQQQQEEYR